MSPDIRLLSLLAARPDNGEAPHLYVARALGTKRSDNIRRKIRNHVRAGWLADDATLTADAQKTLQDVQQAGTADGPMLAPAVILSHRNAADVTAPAISTPSAHMVPHERIEPSPLNYRKTFDLETLQGLAASIEEKGLLQNLLVRPKPGANGERFEIMAGERRWRAIRLLIDEGRLPADHPVPVTIREADDFELLQLALTENDRRDEVHPIERAEAYAAMQDMRTRAGDDAGGVTGEIASAMSRDKRLIQRQIKVARNLGDEARDAYRDGLFTSFAIAETLADWPRDSQTDAIEAMRTTFGPKTAKEVENWLASRCAYEDDVAFDLADYTARGGEIVRIDGSEDQPGKLAHHGLASKLTDEWIAREAARLAGAHDLAGAHQVATFFDSTKHALVPGEIAGEIASEDKYALFTVNQRTLKVETFAPATSPAAIARHERKAAAIAMREAASDPARIGDSNAGEAQAGPPGDDLAKPFERRHWRQAAKARTWAARDGIDQQGERLAMALALIALLPRSAGTQCAVRIAPGHPSGDEAEIGFGDQIWHALAASPVPGIDLDARRVIDEREAIAELCRRDDVPELFKARIADLTLCAAYDAQPGASPSLLGAQDAGYRFPHSGAFNSEGWLATYQAGQLAALARSQGIECKAGASKAEMVRHLAASLPDDWVPAEARFTTATAMTGAVERTLAGLAPE